MDMCQNTQTECSANFKRDGNINLVLQKVKVLGLKDSPSLSVCASQWNIFIKTFHNGGIFTFG